MARPFQGGRRHLLIAGAIAVGALVPHPSVGDDAAPADVDLAVWARDVAAPQLLATLEASEIESGARLATILRGTLETDGAAEFPVHDAGFWSAAVESRQGTQAALAVRLVALAAAGEIETLAPYRELIPHLDDATAPAGLLLHDLAQRLPASPAAPSTATTIELADQALDAGDFALAALAYRAVLLDAAPDDYAYRDIAGHYFYCLHALHAAPDVHSARARFNTTVVFPSVEAQSRARGAATPDATETLTAAD